LLIKASFVTGIVLAAGGSSRLGQPKQLLPFRGSTLLDATLGMARDAGFDQLLLALGGSAQAVRAQVDFAGAQLVENPEFDTGCGSSLRAAMVHVDSRADGVVVLLGDQPGVQAKTIRALIAASDPSGIGVCRYRDGLGHPFWFGRENFVDLAQLHGDKAIWKLLHSGRFDVTEVAVDESIPLDVDTWADYEALLDAELAYTSVVGR
jgi:molybdenum cofactor cytidylyltransferase